MGAVWGDYDNDGYDDLFVYKCGRPELFHNDGGNGFTPRQRTCRPAALDQRQRRRVVRLRPRRQARPVRRRLLVRGRRPLASRRRRRSCPRASSTPKTAAGSTCFATCGDGTFEDVTAKLGLSSRRWTLGVGSGRPGGNGLPGSVSRERLRRPAALSAIKAARGSSRSAATTGLALHAEERHERRVRRHLQRRPAVHLRDQHLRTGRPGPGQRPLGAEEGRARSHTKISRRASASIWAAGAGARSSATSTTMARSTSI